MDNLRLESVIAFLLNPITIQEETSLASALAVVVDELIERL